MKLKLLNNKSCFAICFSIIFISADCPESFYSKTASNFHRHSYYLVVNIKDQNGYRKTVIQNSAFYYFLKVNKIVSDHSEHIALTTKILQNNDTFNIKNLHPEKKYGFLKIVITNPIIDSVARQGKDKFISTYFENRVLKSSIPNSEKPLIIEKLFQWCILSRTHDETGNLLIEK